MASTSPKRISGLGLLLAAISPFGNAWSAEFDPLYYSVDSFDGVATSRYAVTDLDGDGIPDLVFSAKAGTEDVLLVVGKTIGGDLGIKQTLLIPTGTSPVRILRSGDGADPRILVVGRNSLVRELGGWPLAFTGVFSIMPSAVAAVMGDVDADGSDDLTVLTSGRLSTYALPTGNLIRSSPVAASGASDLAFAQLDADSAQELIIGGNVPGLVLDGATHAIDWSYIDGFGSKLATGQLATSLSASWVGARDWYRYTVFRSAPWSPLWSGTTSHDIGAIATAQIDSDGRDVVIVGDGQWGSVRIIDSETRQQRLAIPNPGHGINAIVTGDFDGNGSVDIAFSPGGAIYDPALVIADSTTGATLWSFEAAEAPLTQTAIGDVDGDGRLELVSLDYAPSQTSGVIISDFLTGVEEWRKQESTFGMPGLLDFSISRMELVPDSSGPGMKIVLAGTDNNGAAFAVLDGVTKRVSAHAGQAATNATRDGRMKDIELFDYDHDGVKDFVMVSYGLSTASAGVFLYVFSGIDGTPLWISPLLAPSFQGVNNVLVVGRNDAAPQLVAVLMDSLIAFDAETGAATWTMPAVNDGAIVVANGSGGEELAIFRREGQISFFAASSQALLRSIAVEAPLEAITALDATVPMLLLVKSGGRLALVDSTSGTIVANTDYLGEFVHPAVAPATFRVSDSLWYIAAGSKAALYRERLVLSEHIFAAGFDGDH